MPRPTILEDLENIEENGRTYTDEKIDDYMNVSNIQPTDGAELWMKVVG